MSEQFFMSMLSKPIAPRTDLDWCWYLRRQGKHGEALERALHDIGVLQPGGWSDWHDSMMTDVGAPVEMVFSEDQKTLSLRTEVDDPRKDPSGRFEVACQRALELNGKRPAAAWREVIGAAQSAADLRYGALLGLDQSDAGLAITIYAEIPKDASDLAAVLMPKALKTEFFANQTVIHPSQIAYATQTGEMTFFFKTFGHPAQILPLLGKIAQVSPEAALVDLDRMLAAGLPQGRDIGEFEFSFTFHPHKPAPTLKLYLSTKRIFGSDHEIERQVRAYPGNHLTAYAQLADQLLPAPTGMTHHGLVGLEVCNHAISLFSIGVAAPWVFVHDTL